MPKPRRVEPELLDELPPLDPRAIGSRRDLRRINAWMMQAGIMARLLGQATERQRPPLTMLELGSGDGTFMLSVARRLAPMWPSVSVQLLDRQALVTEDTRAAFAKLGWRAEPVQADVFEALADGGKRDVDVITANLFLHHFEPSRLKLLLEQMARKTRLVAVCEPRRSALALAGSRMIFAIGCNDVSRHDAVVSVRAGFSGRELSDLWPSPGSVAASWRLDETAAGLFTHTFVARCVQAEVTQ